MSLTGQETSASLGVAVPGPWSVGYVRPQGVHKSLQPMWEAPVHAGEGVTRGNCHTIVYGGGLGAGSSSEEDVRATAHLVAAAPDLLALAKKLAGECAECRGRGYTFSDDGITGFGPDDREPTREACADCADIREVIAKAVSP